MNETAGWISAVRWPLAAMSLVQAMTMMAVVTVPVVVVEDRRPVAALRRPIVYGPSASPMKVMPACSQSKICVPLK